MSSHIDLADPLFLDFEYMRWMAALIESRWPRRGRSTRRQKLRGLHLGGGACSLARYFHAAYPDARQVVVELDGKLAEYVRGWFDLPKAPLLRLRVGEAREVTETPHPGDPRLHHPRRLRRFADPAAAHHRRIHRTHQAGPGARRHLRGELRRRPGPEKRPRGRRHHRGRLRAHRHHRRSRHAQGPPLRQHGDGRQRPPLDGDPAAGPPAAGRRRPGPHLERREGACLRRRRARCATTPHRVASPRSPTAP